MEEKRSENDKRLLIIGLILLCCAFIVGALAIRDRVLRYRAEKQLEELAEQTIVEEPEPMIEEEVMEEPEPEVVEEPEVDEEPTEEEKLLAYGVTIPDKEVDFDNLQETVNKDIYAWIYIPDSAIDYPVLQHATDTAYYLNYNLDGSKGYPGCIYTEYYNSKDFTDPLTVVYGHNMKNDTMFAGLHKFEDEEYFNNHPFIYMYTPEKLLVYEIFAACRHSNEHLLFGHDFSNASSMKLYIDDIMKTEGKTSHFRKDLEVTSDSHILTLSTCVPNQADYRYLVQGVLINE
ncbi:MAG: class B sortase [Acetatifactor sp.]|nr:class B sortase [Acetatifactor sp.]